MRLTRFSVIVVGVVVAIVVLRHLLATMPPTWSSV